MRMWIRAAALAVLLAAVPATSEAADWFVAPAGAGGSAAGDGSRQRPFSDPWRALAAASPGDVIRIAEGVYYGRYDRSAWPIDRPRITIVGGYDRQFTRRDPWKQPSVLAFYRDYEGSNEFNLLFGSGDHTGVVIDGLIVDGAGRNTYNSQAPFDLRRGMQAVGALVSFNSPDVVIRNCVFINSTTSAAELRGPGSRFENNIVLNHLGQAMLVLRAATGATQSPMVVRGNTFAFAHDETDPPMGKGGEKGVAIRAAAPAVIEGNVFAATGNAAINLFARAADVSIDRNVFWLTFRAIVAARIDGREVLITERNLGEIEDIGFKSTQENRIVDARLTGLPRDWIDGVSRQMMLSYATPPKAALAALRVRYGLTETVKPPDGDDRGPVAPLLAPTDAALIRVTDAVGARPTDLPAELGPLPAPPAVVQYTRIDWAELNAGAPTLEGRPIEVLVAMGNERNGFMKPGVTAESFLGFDVYAPGANFVPDQIHVYAVRFGLVHRQWQETTKSNNAREAETFYLLRGLGRVTSSTRQRATIEVQSIVAAEMPARPVPARPAGKDWYVRAGATGGDGSKDKPFRDPFQPIEQAAPGDTIHVAAGDYFGRLRSGNWKVASAHLTMLGGYDATFATRDPWKQPTRLVLAPDADRRGHSGEFLGCRDICEGLVLDGFVFDGATANVYFENGALDARASIAGRMVDVRGANITIRNCVFVNANGAAVAVSSVAGTFENNVIVSASGTGFALSADGPGPWTIRRNTFLFAMDPTSRAGTGMSSAGAHLQVRGRATVRIEGNIFGFADNCAVRATTPLDKLSMNGNAFDANLSCHFSDSNRVWLFDAVWDRRLADAGLASARDNVTVLPAGIGIDKAYADRVLPRLFEIKGRYTRDAWLRIATTVGATVAPPPDPIAPTPVVEKPKPEKPKELSIDDLMRELDALKRDAAKPTASKEPPKGPPYAPAYGWQAAMDVASAEAGAAIGARRQIR